MTSHSQSIARPIRVSPAKVILWGLALLGLGVAVLRFTSGIGAVSNMSNAYSFGLWISLDLLCGVALAAGAFTVCAAVYIFNLKQFTPLLRPAILTGFLGYLMVIFALLVDLGRPERIWHLLIYWNLHSPLFEVGLCVMAYSTVLALEFSPMLFEKFGWQKIGHVIHKFTLPLVIIGVLLSTLHQSSLGSLFLIMADKIHPLWHSPLLPVFFYVTAINVGLAMTIFEAAISARAYDREMETPLLSRLAKALPWTLGLYLTLKIGELSVAGELPFLFQSGLLTTLFWIELTAGVLLPLVMLAIPRIRTNTTGLVTAATLVILGLMLNRFNVGLIAWQRPEGSWYFPHWMEFAITIGVVAAGVLAYDWVARNLNLFDHGHHDAAEEVK